MKSLKSAPYLFLKLLIVTISFFSLHSCKTKDQDCFQSVIVLNYASFKARDIVLDTIHSADSVTYKVDTAVLFVDTPLNTPEFTYIQSSASDSFFRLVAYGASVLAAPLNPQQDSIRYRFRSDTASTSADTVTFYYSPTIHFINNSCGYTYYYNLENVKTTMHMLDSAAIINKLVSGSNSTASNVNFYFKKNP